MASNNKNSSGKASESSNEAETGIQNTSLEDTNSPDFYIPSDTPPEVLAYGSELTAARSRKSRKARCAHLKIRI